MNITVKLFASFRLDRFSTENRAYPPGTMVSRIVTDLCLMEHEIGIILVNSRHVPLDHELTDGDTLALFPLMGGG